MSEQEQEQEENMAEVDDRHSDLLAAFEGAEEEEETVEPPVEAAETPEATISPEEPITETPPDDHQEVQDEAPNLDTAPSSLPPAAREAWKDTPPAMREAMAKREKDYEAGVMKYAADAKRAQGMDQTLEPYRPYLEMNGGPGQAIQGLLKTGATLQMGTPQQRVEVVKDIIQQFSVDVGMLDSALVGNQSQAQVNPEVAQLQQQMAQMQQYQQQGQQSAQAQQQQDMLNQWNTFKADPKHEFANDLSNEIANYMDMMARQGQNTSLEDAYAYSCNIRPDIKAIIDGRQSQASVASKRSAASSLHGGPGGPGPKGPTDDSMRSSIEFAMENAGQI